MIRHIHILLIAIILSIFSVKTFAAQNPEMSANAFIAGTLVNATNNFEVDECGISITPDSESERLAALAASITEYASQFLGRKYVWGATGPKTFDCSGFTSYVFRNTGIELPRTSRAQYTQGASVDRSDLRPGDLMFFSSPRSGKGKVGHVAIVVDVDSTAGELTFIHASSKRGITYQRFPDGGYYSRNYIGAKRIIDSTGDNSRPAA